MYLTELELGLPGQLMPLNHSTIHSTPCCPVLTLLFGSFLKPWKHSRTRPDHGCWSGSAIPGVQMSGVQMSDFISKIGHLDPRFYSLIYCDTGGPDVGGPYVRGPDVGGPDVRFPN